jgi:hypothetical protein
MAYKTKKLRGRHRQQGDLTTLLQKIMGVHSKHKLRKPKKLGGGGSTRTDGRTRIHKQIARCSHRPAFVFIFSNKGSSLKIDFVDKGFSKYRRNLILLTLDNAQI